jgi:UDP-3-O-acyl-N-acetylglucosamine deacetylase
MVTEFNFGKILDGNREQLDDAFPHFESIPVDLDWRERPPMEAHTHARTIRSACEVSAPGTFTKHAVRTLRLEPSQQPGWWLDRTDLPDARPIKVSSRNVWTTGELVSNIVLRSGAAGNYVRLVEHIIALKAGTDVDNLLIRTDSGDPPLFNEGSKELVEALNKAGRVEIPNQPVRYLTVSETATIATPHGGFLTIEPSREGKRILEVDCARDFPNAIGKQRIQFTLGEESFNHGALARTNATARQKLILQTIGKLFADSRNLGYTGKNVLVAGRRRYLNAPTHLYNGKSLEAVWHRAILDLLAALALIGEGRFVGKITDYKGGHYPDVQMVNLLYAHGLFIDI